MSDATHKIEGASPEEMAKRINFERLYSNWHAAMAAYNNPDGPDDDEHKEALAEKRDTAEIALLTAPAPLSFCIWQKWEVLDYLVTEECLNVVPLALGAIRADLLRLGVG